MPVHRVAVLAVMFVCLSGFGFAQDEELPLANWVAPPFWNPMAQPRVGDDSGGAIIARAQAMPAGAEALPSSPLPFVAIAPCRIVDTRVALDDGFHRPNFADDEARTFNLPASPDCTGLPATSGAWSLNVQFRPISQLSFLTAYPAGTSRPGVSTMTGGPAAWAQNAAIVPAGTGGAIDVYCQFAARVIIDINGYYGPQSVVTSLTGGGAVLTGDVTLLEGSNVTITPSGNTLMIGASGGPGGELPAGSAGQTLRSDGSGWLASSALTNDGTNVAISGSLLLPATTSTEGRIALGGTPFLHAFGASNVFLGESAGNFVSTGDSNVGVGYRALQSVSSAGSNVAVGASALAADTMGSSNTAVGSAALVANTTGSQSTAVGTGALFRQGFDNGGTPWNADNTAVGFEALNWNQPTTPSEAVKNTGVGSRALHENTTGSANVAVGYAGLMLNTTGSENTAVGTSSLWQNNTGWYNTATGSHGLNSNTFGNANTATGYASLAANQTGSSNTATGAYALYANQDGAENTAAGVNSLFLNDGSFNVAIGWAALADNVTGNGNVAIGHNSAAGFDGDNQLFIGNGLGNLIWGDFDAQRVAINGTSGDHTLVVYGDARVTSLAGIGSVCADADGLLGPCPALAPLLRSQGAGIRGKANAPRPTDVAGVTALLLEITRAQQAQIEALKAELARRDRDVERRLAALERSAR